MREKRRNRLTGQGRRLPIARRAGRRKAAVENMEMMSPRASCWSKVPDRRTKGKQGEAESSLVDVARPSSDLGCEKYQSKAMTLSRRAGCERLTTTHDRGGRLRGALFLSDIDLTETILASISIRD